MQRYVAAHTCEHTIYLESELSAAVVLYSLVSIQWLTVYPMLK